MSTVWELGLSFKGYILVCVHKYNYKIQTTRVWESISVHEQIHPDLLHLHFKLHNTLYIFQVFVTIIEGNYSCLRLCHIL